MDSPLNELLKFVVETADELPVRRRILVYRGLAAVCGDEDDMKRLHAMADALHQAEAICRDQKFSLIQKNTAP
jgi:hypothetical protein